jgi:hypothetical protein
MDQKIVLIALSIKKTVISEHLTSSGLVFSFFDSKNNENIRFRKTICSPSPQAANGWR